MLADLPARPFGSLLVAMVTPFGPDGSLDTDAASALAEDLLAQGCDGLVVSGTTGESPTTSDEEKDALLRAVVEAVGQRATVVAGVSTYDTAHSLTLARAAAKAGADGLLAVTPYYSKPSQDGVYAHLTAIADATDTPVMLYDIPGRSGVALAPDTVLRLAEHPRVLAVKDATNDLFQGTQVMSRTGLAYYSGSDELNLPWLAIGAAGVVSVVGHVAAREYRALIDAVQVGDLDTARRIDRALVPAVRGLMTRTQGAVAAKAALHLQGRLPTQHTRLPLLPATDDEVALVRADLEEAHLL